MLTALSATLSKGLDEHGFTCELAWRAAPPNRAVVSPDPLCYGDCVGLLMCAPNGQERRLEGDCPSTRKPSRQQKLGHERQDRHRGAPDGERQQEPTSSPSAAMTATSTSASERSSSPSAATFSVAAPSVAPALMMIAAGLKGEIVLAGVAGRTVAPDDERGVSRRGCIRRAQERVGGVGVVDEHDLDDAVEHLAGARGGHVRVSVSSTSSSSVARNTAVALVPPAASVIAAGSRVKSPARLPGRRLQAHDGLLLHGRRGRHHPLHLAALRHPRGHRRERVDLDGLGVVLRHRQRLALVAWGRSRGSPVATTVTSPMSFTSS